ncbi:hypothetical protein L2E82_10616 [Cichorium intybus]|uniref:Uncharacterized protein n=1 Tax=Cichorium intybus TaxID=13427 RepID=A0ACB9GC33_CICIN|nr:hypothetical protein L2E82_10616 [Cichorium intybus]
MIHSSNPPPPPMIPIESAHLIASYLVDIGRIQFKDLNAEKSPFQRTHAGQSNMRILVTGGAGFIGSHLLDKLMENEKNEVIVANNYFTGSKDNLRKWIGHPRFELIRHVEVDQIYHLACPASPIFYKHNPVKNFAYIYFREIRIAQIFNTYGLRMNIDDGRVVSNFIAEALCEEPLTVQAPSTWNRLEVSVMLVDGRGEHWTD